MSEHHGEKCDRCGVVGSDRRTLWMACLYEMGELGVPFTQYAFRGALLEKPNGERTRFGQTEFTQTYRDRDAEHNDLRPFYTLRVCKGCRATWMDAIQKWFRSPPGDIERWNNDSTHEPTALATLLSELERLRTDAEAIQQKIANTLADTRQEHDRRERALKP